SRSLAVTSSRLGEMTLNVAFGSGGVSPEGAAAGDAPGVASCATAWPRTAEAANAPAPMPAVRVSARRLIVRGSATLLSVTYGRIPESSGRVMVALSRRWDRNERMAQ